MKTFKYYATILVLAGVLLSGFIYGVYNTTPDERTLRKPLVLSSNNFDGNRIDDDLMNNGMIVSHLVSGRSGLTWPKGNATQTIYASGVWLGGKVDNQVRVVAGEYAGEFAAGPYGSDNADPTSKLYKVSKAMLADPLAFDDFQNWPAHQGAPFVDNNGNGTYEPLPAGPDHPEFIGDQVIWAVMNDGDPTTHSVFHSAPMGLEVQMTIFGFDRPDAFGDMMFVKELIINKGENTINDMIIGLWSDPDLGDAADDLVGCDTTLGMGICYNAGVDVNFAGYSAGTPAVGYDFFQGPMVPAPGESAYMFDRVIPDMRNLKMSSFTKYINSDPTYYDPNNAEEAYYYMSGFMPDGSEFPYIASGGTKFVHPGDPTLDTGPNDTEYVDSDLHPPDDRRFLMNAGPFIMAPGDSQEVVFGILHAAAGGALDSYLYLKEVDALAQLAYDIHFALPPSPPNPTVEVSTFEDEIILSWDAAAELYTAEDQVDKDPDTFENTEFVFEGYNVYQLGTATGSGSVKRLATYDLVNGITEIYDDVFNTTFGETINRRVQFGSDSGIKRSISITTDAINDGTPLLTNRAYYFAVTAYGYNEYGIPKTLESPMQIMTIRPQVNTTWMSEEETAIYGTQVTAVHSAGPSDGSAFASVVDPKALTGDTYELFFDTDHFYLDLDGIWKPTAQPGVIAKLLDISPSVVTGSALVGPGGTIDLHFEVDVASPDYDYAAGVLITVPGARINSATGPDGIVIAIQPDGQSVLFGDTDVDGGGDFAGGEVVTINVAANSVSIPIGFDYVMYDDGWGTLVCDQDGDGVMDPDQADYCNAYGLGPGNSVIANATGSGTIDELGYAFKSLFRWYVRNTNTGAIVTPGQTIQSGAAAENIVDGVLIPAHDATANAYPIAEGLQFGMNGPALDMKWVGVVANAGGAIDPPADGLPYWRYPDWLLVGDGAPNQSDGSTWFFNTHPGYGAGGVETFMNSLVVYSGGGLGIAGLIPYDFELRFTGPGTGRAYDNWGDGWPNGEVDVPFQWWNIGIGTPDDPSDDYQLITWLLDDDGDGRWGVTANDHETSGGTNDPYTDRVYVHAPTDNTPGTVGHDNWWANLIPYTNVAGWTAGPGSNDPGGPMDTWNVMSRTVLMNWNGGDVTDPTFPANMNSQEPEVGTVYRFVTTKPNSGTDKFTVATSAIVGTAKAFDPDGIKVWPNPYFGFNPEERDPVDQQIHFTNLPTSGQCTIRIFDLAGVPVKILHHDNGTTLEVWNVKNDSNIPVASGMYIVIVETEEGDKILKIAIIQPEQRLDLYG
jgi:hypothetical protein